MNAQERINELLQDQEFIEGLRSVNTPEELKEILDERNITLEEGLSYDEALMKMKEYDGSELSEDDLEAVSGGILVTTAVAATATLVVSGLLLCFFVGYGVQTISDAAKSIKASKASKKASAKKGKK